VKAPADHRRDDEDELVADADAGCAELNANRMCMPVNQHRKPTAMNRPIFMRLTAMPTARGAGRGAANGEDPFAEVGPQRHPGGYDNEQDPPEQPDPDRHPRDRELRGEHLLLRAEPWMLDTSLVPTQPVTSLVAARLSPRK
jgi:hypothetical protein